MAHTLWSARCTCGRSPSSEQRALQGGSEGEGGGPREAWAPTAAEAAAAAAATWQQPQTGPCPPPPPLAGAPGTRLHLPAEQVYNG